MHHVQAMYDAIDRLTKLNQSLLLITKIENNQFKEKTSIDLSTVLRERLSNLEELIHARHLTVNTDLAQSIVAMHPMLADILVSNLLVNAIRHNNSNGVINLSSRKGFMSISNSGEAVGLDTNTVFNRFEKSSASDGTGLGLAIVKQICDSYHFSINYTFARGLHGFEILYA